MKEEKLQSALKRMKMKPQYARICERGGGRGREDLASSSMMMASHHQNTPMSEWDSLLHSNYASTKLFFF